MSGLQRILSYAAPAFAVVLALSLAGRAEAAASCGHYVTYKGMPAAHTMPGHGTLSHSAPDEHQGSGDKCPCQGPNCSQAPISTPPLAPTTKLSLEKDPVHYSLCELVLDGGRAADLFSAAPLVIL
jgi:hypothetical protein